MGADAWPEAKRLHQAGLAISEELGDRWNTAISLNYLGQVAYAQGELQEARQQFLTALKIAMAGQVTPVALDALVGLVTLQVSQEPAGDSGLAMKEQAVETLIVVLNQPAIMRETKERAGRLLAELEPQLSPQAVVAAQVSGQTRHLEAVVAKVLAGM
jgi:hypothetical protein